MTERGVKALEKIAYELHEFNRINADWHEYEKQRLDKADQLQQQLLAPMMGPPGDRPTVLVHEAGVTRRPRR
jgi:hypothetical protein